MTKSFKTEEISTTSSTCLTHDIGRERCRNVTTLNIIHDMTKQCFPCSLLDWETDAGENIISRRVQNINQTNT